MTTDIRILKQSEEPDFPEFGKMTWMIRVYFMVGAHGPFTLLRPKDGFTAYDRDQALEAFAREVRTT